MEKIEKIGGFSLATVRSLPELHGVLREFRHDRTGLKLVWLDREEENKTFGIAFETLPEDDTGVFHILEHSVLCGSKRYPVKEPFVELMKNSLNTFLNAMTFPDKTFYPVSSRSEKELVNLMRVYLDAVFHPLIDVRPEIFYQEGWHYAFDSEECVGYTGVVLNEMKGAFSSADQRLQAAMHRALFPDTPYRFVSGGDPRHIPELTYERFLAFHRKCYHPSNGYVFLDGTMDIEKILRVIDEEYLKDFTAEERPAPPALQAPVKAGRQEITYELAQGEDPEGHTRTGWGFVIGTFDQREKLMALRVLAQVLCGSHQAPLSRALLSGGLAQEVSMQVIDGIAQPWLLLDVKNLRSEDLDAVERCVSDTLKDLVRNGLDRGLVDAALSNLEFRIRERDYGYMPEGLVLGLQVMESWLYGGDAAANLEIGDLFECLREKAENGYFERLIREVLLENPHTCQVVMHPSHTVGSEMRCQEQQRLEEISSGWSMEEKKRLVELQEHLEKWQKQEDSPEALASLPRLSVEDLPTIPENIPISAEKIHGIPVLRHSLATNGIVYGTLYFDADGFDSEELSALSFLCTLIGKLKTVGNSAAEILQKTQRLCGNLDAYLSAFPEKGHPDRCHVKLCVSFSTLEEHAEEAAEHVVELLTETSFRETSAMIDLLRQRKNQMYQQILMSGSGFAMSRISAQTSAAGAAGEAISGIRFYQWLCAAETSWEDGSLPKKMESLAKRVFDRRGLTFSYTCGEDSSLGGMSAVFAALPDRTSPELSGARSVFSPAGERKPSPQRIRPAGRRKEGIIVAADVAFTARGANLTAFGQEYTGSLALAARCITLNYLWNEIRVRGGAYGTGLTVSPSGLACCYSYRDPNGSRSLALYTKAEGYLKTFCQKTPDLTGLMIGAVSDASPLQTPKTKAISSDQDYWCGITREDRCRWRKELLKTTPDTLNALAAALEQTIAQAGTCLIGPREQIEACQDLDLIQTL